MYRIVAIPRHDSLLNADTINDVLALFRTCGYRFVSLAEAQKDALREAASLIADGIPSKPPQG